MVDPRGQPHRRDSAGHGTPTGRAALIDYLGRFDRFTLERRMLTLIGIAEWSTTTMVRPWEQRRARRMAQQGHPIRLHLGCGTQHKGGWINVDYAQPTWILRLGRPVAIFTGWIDRQQTQPVARADLSWDLSRPLPFSSNSVEAVFAEHVLEHFTYSAGLKVLRNCHRVLRPGGVLRLGVPDLERYSRGYLGMDPILDQCRPGRPTRAVAFAEIFYRYGHRSAYDAETLLMACRESGFARAEPSVFGQGSIGAATDSESRREDTLYVEAVK